jgi:hypothetical protein
MLTYSIEHKLGRDSLLVKTMHVEGKVEPWQGERLKRIIMDALYGCDHLILDTTKAEELPPSFIDMVIYFRNIAKYIDKSFTVTGYYTGAISRKKEPHTGRRQPLKK